MFNIFKYIQYIQIYSNKQKISPGAEVWAAAVSNEWTIDLFFSLISLSRFCAMMVHWVIIDLFGSSGSIGKKSKNYHITVFQLYSIMSSIF